MPAGSPAVTYRTQVVIGTQNPDTISIVNGQYTLNGVTTPFAANVNKAIFYGLAGDDTINAGGLTNMPVELIGGSGNDTLTGGAQDDVLTGNNPGDYALADPYTGDTRPTAWSAGAATTRSTAASATTPWPAAPATTATSRCPAAPTC